MSFAALRPGLVVHDVRDIDLDRLAALGIKGVIVDVDNTLVAWGGSAPPREIVDWFGRLRARGFSACLLSNAGERRVQAFAAQLGVPAVANAAKPRRRGFLAALGLLGTGPSSTAVIGDQIFTDVWGGNRLGLFTILVTPISRREFVGTRLVRLLERWIARRPPVDPGARREA